MLIIKCTYLSNIYRKVSLFFKVGNFDIRNRSVTKTFTRCNYWDGTVRTGNARMYVNVYS